MRERQGEMQRKDKREAGGDIRRHETRGEVEISGNEVIDRRQTMRKGIKEERLGG